MPGAAEAVRAFAKLARERGVNRLVLLSRRGEQEAQRAERMIQEAGTEWTIVRCSFFAQNLSENFFLDQVLGGEVALTARNVAEPFVDAEDVAEVAVAALTQGGHAGELYELTGPRLPTFACVGLVVCAAVASDERHAAMVIVGGALYIVGTTGVTIVCNVPLNDGLATLLPQRADAADRWDEYLTKWTAWNHVRAVAALSAAAVLTAALRV